MLLYRHVRQNQNKLAKRTHKYELPPPAPSSLVKIFKTQTEAKVSGRGMNMSTQTEAVCKCFTQKNVLHKMMMNKTHTPVPKPKVIRLNI